MLELQPTALSVIGCFARSDKLDALDANGAYRVRVAEDELWLLVGPAEVDQTIADATNRLETDALVVDLSDGHAAWTLLGDDRGEIVCRLSAIPMPTPPACVQGLFAHVPAKLLLSEDAFTVIVPATVSEYVRDRIALACDCLEFQQAEEVPFAWKTLGQTV